jgi:hypothetical protein
VNRHRSSQWVLGVLAVLVAGCGPPRSGEFPPLSGRRVQGTTLIAHGAVPYRVDAYELTFAHRSGVELQARRAGLLVDMAAAGQGHVRGFIEWGRSGELPMTYVAGGWARQTAATGQLVTVFELALNYLELPDARHGVMAPERTPLAVRVVVNEASGDVTLTRRR